MTSQWFWAGIFCVLCWTPRLPKTDATLVWSTAQRCWRRDRHALRACAQIPPTTIRVATAITEEIDRSRFDREILAPIAAWITRHAAHDSILYIVLTKGIPLRIQGSSGANGSVASVDSELTLLYRRLVGAPAAVPGRIPNPYFRGDRTVGVGRAFSHATTTFIS